jgi:group II intron reverse transcriptase/maturase
MENEPRLKAKPYEIPKRLVWEAYKRVKRNHGAAGVDGESLQMFEQSLGKNLYKIWNRMSSGSYFPSPVRLVEIEKKDGGVRPLGIPTVADRVAQTAVKMVMEPRLEAVFHPNSYGYRPGKSAHQALEVARTRCFSYDWVIDLDIKGFFDSIPHELVERAVARHIEGSWVRLYVARWLRASLQRADGTIEARTQGTPQGGVISPLLANLFLHYAFDVWMQRHHAATPFERYADDVIVHCRSEQEALQVLEAIRERLAACGLTLHPTKTRIVYCQDSKRRGKSEQVSFDFLSHTFKARPVQSRYGRRQVFFGFLPAISRTAAQAIRQAIHEWKLGAKIHLPLDTIAALVNPQVRGWVQYFGRFYRSECCEVLQHLNRALVRWARKKFKRFHHTWRATERWLQGIARRSTPLFAHWVAGARPMVGV